MRCPLCGLEFKVEEGVEACGNCPLKSGCKMVMCPRCGYEMIVESRILNLIKKLRVKMFGVKF